MTSYPVQCPACGSCFNADTWERHQNDFRSGYNAATAIEAFLRWAVAPEWRILEDHEVLRLDDQFESNSIHMRWYRWGHEGNVISELRAKPHLGYQYVRFRRMVN